VEDPEGTLWTVIRSAAAGDREARDTFAKRYEPVIHAYLRARWSGSPLLGEVDDATQDVFLDCFKDGGALARVDEDRPGGFRAFLFGVVRMTALNLERKHARRRARPADDSRGMDRFPADDEGLSTIFDRAWATTLLEQAADRQAELAKEKGDDAVRRVELLELRFAEGLPIRDIARRWEVDAAHLHHEYARARDEFRSALREVVGFHHRGRPGDVERECSRLLDLFD
jgi:RNA polymerase sigma-70 factor (ECF subfamily)